MLNNEEKRELKEMLAVWDARRRHMEGVKASYTERLASIDAALAKVQARRDQLVNDYATADDVIAECARKTASAERQLALANERPSRQGRRRETKVEKVLRLRRELAALERDLADEISEGEAAS